MERRADRSAARGDFILERKQNAGGIPHMCSRFYQVLRFFPSRESSQIDETSGPPSAGGRGKRAARPGSLDQRACRSGASGDFILECNQSAGGILHTSSRMHQVFRFFPGRESRQVDVTPGPLGRVALQKQRRAQGTWTGVLVGLELAGILF